MDFSLLQGHTTRLYRLDEHPYKIQIVKARSLLSVSRFDLFAKLYYARNRSECPQLAKEVYLKHIKAFNPDGCEPGRSDKCSFEAFISTFDYLLDYFKNNEFDSTKSIVPITTDGIILDGAHRIAALAFYDKEVTVAVFEDVVPVGQFNYQYFKERGLSQNICDIIAKEVLSWIPNCLVACLWPRMGNNKQKEKAFKLLENNSLPFYHKTIEVNLNSLTLFMVKVYQKQPWIGNNENHFAGAKDKAFNCYAKGNKLDLFFFASSKSLEEILELKEQIRCLYPYNKHSIHITDNNAETRDIAYFALTTKGLEQWLLKGKWRNLYRIKCVITESIYIFKHTYWLGFKVFVASFLLALKKKHL